jgi:hypothetical protein
VEAVKADPGVEDPTQIVTEAHKGALALADIPVEAPGSGSEHWSVGAWTEAGDGTGYPENPPVAAVLPSGELKAFADLTPEEKAAIVYPYGDIVTESGKTQEQLDADIARQKSE